MADFLLKVHFLAFQNLNLLLKFEHLTFQNWILLAALEAFIRVQGIKLFLALDQLLLEIIL
jgi:hypothetical protein